MKILDPGHAHQRLGDVQFGFQEAKGMKDRFLAADCKRIEGRPTDLNGVSSERERASNVGACAETAIDQERKPAAATKSGRTSIEATAPSS
ncbi:hypothetical protein ACVW1B_005854 [Bradyrhizobium sp. USDA 4502]